MLDSEPEDEAWLAGRRCCILCLQASETMDHILLGCVFSRQVWVRLLSRIGLVALVAVADVNIFVWWPAARWRVPRACRKGFDTPIMLTCWLLWKERNSRSFGGAASDANAVVTAILMEAELWLRAGYSSLASLAALL